MCVNIILLTFWKEEIEEVIWVMKGVPRYSDTSFWQNLFYAPKKIHILMQFQPGHLNLRSSTKSPESSFMQAAHFLPSLPQVFLMSMNLTYLH